MAPLKTDQDGEVSPTDFMVLIIGGLAIVA
jgi:hypothetical protein